MTKDVENGNGTVSKAKAGTASFLIELEKRRSIKVGSNFIFTSPFGLIITRIADVSSCGLINSSFAGFWEEHFHWTDLNFLRRRLLLPLLTSIQLGNKRSMAHFEGRGA